MIGYAKDNKQCRSQFIGHYFGDVQAATCGVCDYCLHQKNKNLSSAQFNSIERIIRESPDGSIEINELLKASNYMNPTRIWEILNFLQAEAKIEISIFP